MPSIPRKTYYVYLLTRPDGTPFYVGKGKGKRMYAHKRAARRGCACHKCNVIRKVWRQGQDIGYVRVMETDNEQEAFDCERMLISLYGRHTLTNKTDGGEGASGTRHTAEAKTKIGKASRGRKRIGQPHSEEWKQKISEQMKGRVFTPEWRRKISENQKGRIISDSAREAVRQARTGSKASPETRARMSESQRARWAKRKQEQCNQQDTT